MGRLSTACIGGLNSCAIALLVGLVCSQPAWAQEQPISFPEVWKVERETSDSGTFWSADRIENGATTAFVVVTKTAVQKPDIRQALALAESIQERQLKSSARCGPMATVSVDSQNAVMAICDYKAARMTIHFTVVNGRDASYMFQFSAKTGSYEKYVPEWNAMLKDAKIR